MTAEALTDPRLICDEVMLLLFLALVGIGPTSMICPKRCNELSADRAFLDVPFVLFAGLWQGA